MRQFISLLVGVCLCSACGTPLTTDTYQGEGLLTLRGNIASLAPAEVFGDYYMGIAWLGPLVMEENAPVPFAFEQVSVTHMRFPTWFHFTILEPPPPVALWFEQFAFGVLEVLEDTRGDGEVAYSYAEINNSAGPVRGFVPTHFIEYNRQTGFTLIAGSASIVGKPGCPENAAPVAPDTVLTLVSNREDHPVCWGRGDL